MRPKKFLYVIHLSGKRVNRLWLTALNAANHLGFEVHLACNMAEIEPEEWEKDCEKYHLITHQIDFCRNPLDRVNKKAYKQLLELMKNEKFNIVHCNTPIGGFLSRICAHKAKIPYVIYQAHGFHFYKGAPLINWFAYFPVEWICSFMTDVLITINMEDYNFAKKHMNAKRIEYVPGVGIDLEKFANGDFNKEHKRKELGIPPTANWILTVGEMTKNKNHAALIKAIKDIPNTWLTIAGTGAEKEDLCKLISTLHLENRVKLLGFRNDIKELCYSADIFAFPSYREGLSVALMEAMACGKPILCSRIRGNTDLVDSQGGELFAPGDQEELNCALQKILNRNWLEMGNYNKEKMKAFDSKEVQKELEALYTAF